MERQTGQRGFTLIEIAVVLVIVGVLIAATVAGVKPVVLSSKISQTNTKMDRIELALLAYVMRNGCLPCPADGTLANNDADAGWSHSDVGYYGPNHTTNNQPCAAPNGTACEGNLGDMGVVPWNTLGIKDSETADAWQNRISYAVTSDLALTAGTSMMRTAPASYPAGELVVCNNTGAAVAPCTGSGSPQTSAAAYVLISHGPDRSYGRSAANGVIMPNSHGVATTNQQVNSFAAPGTGLTFRQDRPVTAEGATYFDDIVRFKTAPIIIQDCGKNACGNPA